MTALEVSTTVDELMLDHLADVLGEDVDGWAFTGVGSEQYVTTTGKVAHGAWRDRAWMWPSQAGELAAYLAERDAAGDDCYVVPSLSSNPVREGTKRRQIPPGYLWADLDGIPHPERLAELVRRGAWTTASGSPDSRHLWVPMAERVDPDVAADLLVRLAAWLGADPAPARLNAYLRPLGTRNHKARVLGTGEAVPVTLVDRPRIGFEFTPDELDELLPPAMRVAGEPAVDVDAEPLPDGLPADLEELLAEKVTAGMDRSARTITAVRACLRAGLTEGQTMTALSRHAPTVEKYGAAGSPRFTTEVGRSIGKARAKLTQDEDRRAAVGSFADAALELGKRRQADEGGDGTRRPSDDEAEAVHAPPALLFEDVAAVARRVDSAPPPRFLARPVWVEDAYGVIGAEDKAGKSWAGLDLAVAVASGGRWLDLYRCETPGPVLLFLGEGSDRKTVRRLRAVCEFHGVALDDLSIRVCHRAPKLKRSDHLEAIHHELDRNPPRLVVLDPLYLSLGDTKTSQLSEMGDVLGEIQYACQRAGAALVIVHHWNQTGTGNDRKRFTGAGAAEWGRVLASIAVDAKRTTNGDDSVVEQTWRFIGDEIPDTTARVVRRVWVDDLEDLKSPMHYAVTPPPAGPRVVEDDTSRDDELRDAILERLADGRELSGNALIAAVRNAGHEARDQDVRRVALALSDGGPLHMRIGARNAHMFRLKEAGS